MFHLIILIQKQLITRSVLQAYISDMKQIQLNWIFYKGHLCENFYH